MSHKILIAIDGTGAWSNTQYAAEMENSFVSQIYKRSEIPASMKFYHRGPSLTGMESGYVGLKALLDYIGGLRVAKKSKPIEIYITGYSRGGMIAVYVANRIALYNDINGMLDKGSNVMKRSFGFTTEEPASIVIKKMLLFDAVDSDLTMYGPGLSTIPSIVGHVDHFTCQASSTPLPRSRWYFERIDLTYTPPTTLKLHPYGCTHSAIGGLPGQGDHRIPTDAKGVVNAGLVGMAKTGTQVVMNPGFAMAAGARESAAAAWDSVRSNVTLEEDWKIYASVLRDVNSCLDGFECKSLPAFPRPKK